MYIGSIIAGAVSQIKADFGGIFERHVLQSICKSSGCTWRERLLPPARTVELLLIQILYGNTAISHLRRIAGLSFSPSAFCQARSRMPLEVLQRILSKLVKRFIRDNDGGWLGHRTFLIDGSSFTTPDTEKLGEHFKYPPGQKEGCGFPVGHLLALFHAETGMVKSLIPAGGYTHDMSQASMMHTALRNGDIMVGDRAFCSFNHLALLQQRKLHAVFRMHQRLLISNQRCIKKISKNDKIIEYCKPKKAPSWMKQEDFDSLPKSIVVRWISYKVQRAGFRTKEVSLLTTLIDHRPYPATAISELYQSRWEIETNFNHLKTTMGMDTLRCKSVDGVLKEIFAFAIVYNLVRLVMIQSARLKQVKVCKVSFIDALRSLCHPADIPMIINPVRKNRLYPRAIKRRPKQYDRLNKPYFAYKSALSGLS